MASGGGTTAPTPSGAVARVALQPTIERRDGGWRARFVTWQHQYAVLDRWEVDVDESGRIHAQRERIAHGVGTEAGID